VSYFAQSARITAKLIGNAAGIFLQVRTLPAAHFLTGRKSMIRTFMIAAASAAVLTLSPTAFAMSDHGTADEAKAMLAKTVAALKADKARTIERHWVSSSAFFGS
jgi:hypothetical protein